MVQEKAFLKAEKRVALTFALQAAWKGCWMDMLQVVETAALTVDWLAET